MDGLHPQRQKAHDFLIMIKDNPDFWKRVDAILETSKQDASKFFALQVLGEAIATRWKIIPSDQRLGIRNYIVSKIISLSNNEETMRKNHTLLSRLNLVLVHILKQDWPHAWPTFIADIAGSSRVSESLCENNMRILKLLSEEVFDFSRDTMTTGKTKKLKESLNDEFSKIFQLCEMVLTTSQNPSLLKSTLETLQKVLSWIPLGYIFETPLISVLITKFFPVNLFRTVVVDCLTEVASLPPGDVPENYTTVLVHLFITFMQQLGTQIPLETNLAAAYSAGSDDDCVFFHRLALLLSTFLINYVDLFVQPDGTLLHYDIAIVPAYLYMIRLSEIEDEEIFKTCLELWHHFTKSLYTASVASGPRLPNPAFGVTPGMQAFTPGAIQSRVVLQKIAALEPVLHLLRIVIIDHMAKPEEVIIVEDDNGEIVREHTKDTEVIAQYKTMREAIVYLAHLNYDDTETIMLQKLELQVTGGQFTWNGLNTLCWAMGSISGAMSEMDEKRFLVSIIKDLLKLCEEQRGKDNKAVVASNIMYIVGQYPRFLRAHWKFLKTVVNKLFEFMHELHPGVQDMACDTFLKIAQKCKRKFMTPQLEDPEPFILSLIADLERHTHDLQPHQVLSFYESVGTILSDNGPSIRLPREIVILRLMDSVNNNWNAIVAEGSRDPNTLFSVEAVKEITRIMKINTKVCSSAGSIFVHQLSLIFMDTLKVYKLYSEQINAACATHGQYATRLMLYKAMKGVKGDILELLTAFMECSKDLQGGPQSVLPVMLPPMMMEILGDYRNSAPQARDARVLSLFSTMIGVLKENIANDLPNILDAVFQPTLEMITTNMLDYPDLRINFFRFLREANQHCFYGLFNVPPHLQKLIVDSIVWAFRHTERNISETGLEILEELLRNVSLNPTLAQPFYQSFLLSLIRDVMVIMTDRLHKSGFKSQAAVLMHIFHLVEAGGVTAPLFDPATINGPMPQSNSQFLKEHVAGLLLGAFPNVTQAQVVAFVVGLFDVTKDINMFKQHLRDFLIAVKEFASEDNSDLYLEEVEARQEETKQQQRLYRQSVPGLLNPEEVELGDLDYDEEA